MIYPSIGFFANQEARQNMLFPTNSVLYTDKVFPFVQRRTVADTCSLLYNDSLSGYSIFEKFFRMISEARPLDAEFKQVLDENFFELLA